jgi:hypothetical protein
VFVTSFDRTNLFKRPPHSCTLSSSHTTISPNITANISNIAKVVPLKGLMNRMTVANTIRISSILANRDYDSL